MAKGSKRKTNGKAVDAVDVATGRKAPSTAVSKQAYTQRQAYPIEGVGVPVQGTVDRGKAPNTGPAAARVLPGAGEGRGPDGADSPGGALDPAALTRMAKSASTAEDDTIR